MSELSAKSCVPCRGGVPPLSGEPLRALSAQLPGWEVMAGQRLHHQFDFPDFASPLAFVNRAGAIAEHEGHHPDLCLSWGKVEATIYTHKIQGLTESDFILAAKLEEAYSAKS